MMSRRQRLVALGWATIFLKGTVAALFSTCPFKRPCTTTITRPVSKHDDLDPPALASSRRDLLSFGLSSFALVGATTLPANAFANKISDKYDDRPKRRGPQPKDLGIATRKDMVGEEYRGLKNCGAAPNCFCSTDDAQDDPEHNIPAWSWPVDFDRAGAFADLKQVVDDYKPGQGNVDGGGFQIVTYEPEKGYMYIQFESLKNGYIDDVELACIDGNGDVQVRSSSRVGYLDFGVNAKRLNYIAKAMRSKGWQAPGVDLANHQDYAIQNNMQ